MLQSPIAPPSFTNYYTYFESPTSDHSPELPLKNKEDKALKEKVFAVRLGFKCLLCCLDSRENKRYISYSSQSFFTVLSVIKALNLDNLAACNAKHLVAIAELANFLYQQQTFTVIKNIDEFKESFKKQCELGLSPNLTDCYPQADVILAQIKLPQIVVHSSSQHLQFYTYNSYGVPYQVDIPLKDDSIASYKLLTHQN